MAKKSTNNKTNIVEIVNRIESALKGVYGSVNKISNTWAKVDQASANFAKSVGMAAAGMEQLRKTTIDLVHSSKLAINFGVNAEKLIQLQNQYVQAIGRNVKSNVAGLENFAAMSRVLTDQGAVDMIAKLENFGVSMEETGNRVGKMFADASKKGISFETYSKNFLNNIEIAQNYTFAEGLRGLENMAKKASQIKLDMQQTASFANKVNTVEGSINTAAKLQVLGGTFSQFADPLSMLNESLNDMEALQDRLINIMGNLGQFNKQTGEVEISAFNKMRINAASEAMGVSSSEMMKMINSKARRNEIENQLGSRTDLNQDVKDMILNMGVIQNGVAGVNIDGEFKELSKISNNDQQTLIKQNQTQTEDIKEIVRMLRGWDDMRKGRISQYENAMAKSIGSVTGRVTKIADEIIGSATNLLKVGALVFGGGSLIKGFAGPLLKRKDGGLLNGPSHENGGMPIVGSNIEVEGGEFVVNKQATKKNLPLLKAINKDKYADGGVLGGTESSSNIVGDLLMYDLIKNEITKFNKLRNASPETLKRLKSLKAKEISRLKSGVKVGGAALGLLTAAMGGVSTYETDKETREGKIERGSDEHKRAVRNNLISTYSGIGSAIGSFIPFPIIGTLLGSVAGVIAGVVHSDLKNKANEEAKLHKDTLNFSGINLKGDYKKREIEKIMKAMSGDKYITHSEFLSFEKDLQDRLIRNKDYTLPKDRVYRRNGGLLNGPSHENGGMSIVGSNIEVEGGEFVVNKQATKKYLPLLKTINNDSGDKKQDNEIIKPRIDEKQKPLAVTPTNNQQLVNSVNPIDMKPLKIDISGSIKLDVPNGQNIDILKELTKNPQFVNALTNLIEKQMVINNRGGNIVSKGLK